MSEINPKMEFKWKKIQAGLYQMVIEIENGIIARHTLKNVDGVWNYHCNDPLGWRPNFKEKTFLGAVTTVGAIIGSRR